MARKSDTYRSNNKSDNSQRGKLRRILRAQEKAGIETPSIPEIREALERKNNTIIQENIQE